LTLQRRALQLGRISHLVALYADRAFLPSWAVALEAAALQEFE